MNNISQAPNKNRKFDELRTNTAKFIYYLANQISNLLLPTDNKYVECLAGF